MWSKARKKTRESRESRHYSLRSQKIALLSRFTGVRRERGHWRASISVRGSTVELGAYDDEEDAARAYDAAVFKYDLQGNCRYTINFPGEAPLASVLAALPDPAPPRRSGRAPAPKRKVDAPGPVLRCERGLPLRRTKKKPKQKSVEGSRQKKSGKWFHRSFPGREFEDLDAIRAAKRQRAEQRAAYSAQLDAYTGS